MKKKMVHGGDIYRHPGVIDFSSNMNPLGTPPEVIEAARESLEHISDYPDVQCERLTEALAASEGLPADWIICGSGAADLIFSLAQALRPKRALIQAPTFAEYQQALESIGCTVDRYDTSGTGFWVDEGFLNALTSELDVVFLCNPNNPTGFLICDSLLREIILRCRELQIRMVLDECFLDFLPDEGDHTCKDLLKECPNLFILKAFTKRYAMAGLRLGYGLCADEELLIKMSESSQPWNVSLPAQAAGVAALKLTDYVKAGNIVVARELDFLKNSLRQLGFQVYDSKANYIFFRGPEDLQDHCLERGLLIRSCANYYGLDRSYYRIAVRRHEDNLKLLQALSDYPAPADERQI